MNVAILGVVMGVVFFSCKKDHDETPTTGTLKGTVTDNSNSQAIANVRIIVYDANTNSPTGNAVLTKSDGTY